MFITGVNILDLLPKCFFYVGRHFDRNSPKRVILGVGWIVVLFYRKTRTSYYAFDTVYIVHIHEDMGLSFSLSS